LYRYYHLVFTPISGICSLSVNLQFGYTLNYGITSLNSLGKLNSSQIPTLTLGNNLSDCLISSPSNNQLLIYNGSQWINAQGDHTKLSNIGTNTHATIDNYLNWSQLALANSCYTYVDLNSVGTSPSSTKYVYFYTYNQVYPTVSLYQNVYSPSISNATTASRYNFDATYALTITQIVYSVSSITNGFYVDIYGSNYINNLFDTSTTDLSSLTKINTTSLTLNSVTNSSFSLPSSYFRFFHLVFTPISGTCSISVNLQFAYTLSYGIATLNSSGVLTTSQIPPLTLGSNLTDVSVASIANKNILRWNGTNWVNTADLTIAETNITNLQISTGTAKTQSSVSQNTAITTTYVDGTDNYIVFANNTTSSTMTPTSAKGYIQAGTNITVNGYYVNNGGWTEWNGISNTTSYNRYNIAYASPFQISYVYWVFTGTPTNGSNLLFSVYGATNVSAYNDTGNDTTNLTLLGTFSPTTTTGNVAISNSSSFQYVIIIIQNISASPATTYGTNNGSYGFMCKRLQVVSVH